MRISRHYSDHHLKKDNTEVRVTVYEDQVRGWFFDQARILEKSSNHGAFVLLLVILSYVEGHAIFYKGTDSKGNSKSFFRDAFKAIFPLKHSNSEILDKAVDELYHQVRCRLFHTGMIREKVVLSGEFSQSISIIPNEKGDDFLQIQINPHKALDEVENHFSHYIIRLRNPDEKKLRENFDKAWKMRHEY